jgi:flagellar basal-body rod protein FlgC
MSFDALDISASGLYAQRLKMDTVSSNIANVNTTRNPDGTTGAYVKKQVVFSAVYNQMKKSPEAATENVSPVYDVNQGGIVLKGGINFDSPNMANGVEVSQIANDKDPYKMVYNPGHPDANKDGFVQMPNINVVTEMIDMMIASRCYEANISSIEATKSMINSAMKI